MAELSEEPQYLPSILPLGLIGNGTGSGIISGIAFHKTVIPKYNKSDLAKRLLWLLTKQGEEPIIKPYKLDCDLESDDFQKILTTGIGSVTYKPHIDEKEIDVTRNNKKQKIKIIEISGNSPLNTFDPLLNAYDKGKIPISNIIDQSKFMDISIYIETKRGIDNSELITKLSDKYLNKTINFKCYTCNLQGQVILTSIDELLLNAFKYWKKAYINHLHKEVKKLNYKSLEYTICFIIRRELDHNVQDIKEIITNCHKNKMNLTSVYYKVDENNNIYEDKYIIEDDDIINIYNKTPIKKLVEYTHTHEEVEKEKNELQKQLNDVNKYSIDKIKEILN